MNDKAPTPMVTVYLPDALAAGTYKIRSIGADEYIAEGYPVGGTVTRPVRLSSEPRDRVLFPDLHLTDPSMTIHRVSEDLVWGFRSYLNELGTVMYAMQVSFRLPGDPRIVLVGESRVADPAARPERLSAPELVARMMEIITSPQRRQELHAMMLAGVQEGY